MELYSEYIKEREGLDLIRNDHGFLAYKCIGDECFIADIFVSKEHRGGFVLGELIKEVGKVAVINGCSHLSGILRAADPGINRTMKAALKLGFIINNIKNDGVTIVKELKGDVWAV